jgi:outer membrane lipoprotein-sorting protein
MRTATRKNLFSISQSNRQKQAFFAALLCVLCALIVLCVTLKSSAQTLSVSPRSASSSASTSPNASPIPSLSVDQIVFQLETRNRERAAALRSFQATRTYTMHYTGPFGERNAEMTVSLTYNSPNEKNFVILSQSGTKFILDHIFKRLLDEEKAASNEENRLRTALTSRNYDFTLAAYEDSSDSPQYVLNVIPKSENKYLYRGKIWVDAKDFAVTRIEAEPAKNPSFWIKKSSINHKYQKVENFWLPAQNKTESQIRIGGTALLTIEYNSYKLTDTVPLQASIDDPTHNIRVAQAH